MLPRFCFLEHVQMKKHHPKTFFFSVLLGYVPDSSSISQRSEREKRHCGPVSHFATNKLKVQSRAAQAKGKNQRSE